MIRKQSFCNNKATLYVIATPIGNLKEISPRVIESINDSKAIFCEDTRVTGLLLNHLNISKPLISAYENIEKQSSIKMLEYLNNNENVAFMSDAGYPGISDPGHILIKEAIKNDFNVVVVNGPSALIQSVLASGFDTTHFYFYGFLDPRQNKRKAELENLKDFKDTIIFYQSPHKIKSCLEDMYEIFGDRNICLCRELTKKFEEYIRGTISEIIPICESLKGEMVIVIEGNKKENKEKIDIDEVLDEIETISKNENKRPKEIIKEYAKKYNLSTNELYQAYIKKKEEN